MCRTALGLGAIPRRLRVAHLYEAIDVHDVLNPARPGYRNNQTRISDNS